MTDKIHPYHGLEQPDTNNATWFNPNQKSTSDYWREGECWLSSSAFRHQQKSETWKYLGQMNDGIRNGKRTNDPLFTYLDNSDLIENVALQLDLPKRYWSTAKRYYWCIHGEHISGVRKDSTAISIVEYVIHTQQENRQFHPNTKLGDGQTVAKFLSERFNISIKTVYKRYGQVAKLIETEDMTDEPQKFDQRNMSRRGLPEDGVGEYTGD